MARKRDYAAEYARRKARGAAAGKTLQAARGHRPAEHVARAERERRQRGLSSAEERTVRRWAEARRDGTRGFAKNKDLDPQDLVDWAAAQGYRAFQAFQRQNEAARRQYRSESRRGRYVSRGTGGLADVYSGGRGGGPDAFGAGLVEEAWEDFEFDYYDTEELPVGWLFYH